MNQVSNQAVMENCLNHCEGYIWHTLTREFSQFARYYDDLAQEAKIAVCQAAAGYDPSKGTYTTYFKPYIWHAITQYLYKNVTGYTGYYQPIAKKIRQYCQEHPGSDLENSHVISIKVGVPEKAVRHIKKVNKTMAPLDDTVVPTKQDVAEEVTNSLLSDKIKELIQSDLFTEDEKYCLCRYYGLDGEPAINSMEIARQSDGSINSKYFVKKYLASAIGKLRQALGVNIDPEHDGNRFI